MKKRVKFALCVIGILFALIFALWFSIYYQVNLKQTVCDISVSPDGSYELTLLAIGEPDWPFGPASGRLVLKQANQTLCQADFRLANDGAQLGSDCWAVSWQEDYAEVTLSGEDQEDAHILLYYDGSESSRYVSHESEATSPVMALEISALENRENELVFDISIDDFIESYNSFYAADHNASYLAPKSAWRVLTYDDTVHSNHETSLYEFSLDEAVWSQPTITVYVPTNGDCIQEVTINFDEHGYSDTFYEHFEELCFYTLRVFFPNLEEDAIHSLYREANELGNLNVFLNEDGYEKGCVPCVLYHKDGIGVYPYFAIGEWTHLCIVPVTDEMLEEYAAKGTEIHEIE